MVRIFGNAVGWTANAAKLSSVGLWLNASKSESMLAATIFTLTGVFVPIAFWSTRYFTTLPNVGRVKSSVDDLNGTGYCKHESSLCATICWGSASVPGFVRWTARLLLCFLFRSLPILSPPHNIHIDVCFQLGCSNTAKRAPTRNPTPLVLFSCAKKARREDGWRLGFLPATAAGTVVSWSLTSGFFLFHRVISFSISFTTINQSQSIHHHRALNNQPNYLFYERTCNLLGEKIKGSLV